MRGVTVPSVARLLSVATVSLILVGGAAATGASDTPAPPAARIRLASLAPHGAAGPMTFQQIATAAQTCASYAAATGWANNGTYGIHLALAKPRRPFLTWQDRWHAVMDCSAKLVGHRRYDRHVAGRAIPPALP